MAARLAQFVANFLVCVRLAASVSPSPPPSRPPLPPSRPPLSAPRYNLQIYGYNNVGSPHFPPNTCGNRWLDLYNACPAMGGIGHCGKWDTTADEMVACGLQSDPNLPWKNSSSHRREEVVAKFCECISCAFLPAVRDNATLIIPQQCETDDTPSLPSLIDKLAIELCDYAVPEALDACSGFEWSAKSRCESGESRCLMLELTLSGSAAAFDEHAQLALLARLAGLAGVPINSLYVKSVREGSVVVAVGVYPSYADKFRAAVVGGMSGASPSSGGHLDALSLALGLEVLQVEVLQASSGGDSLSGGGAGGGGGSVPALVIALAVCLSIGTALFFTWLCRGLRAYQAGLDTDRLAAETTAAVIISRSPSGIKLPPPAQPPPPPTAPPEPPAPRVDVEPADWSDAVADKL